MGIRRAFPGPPQNSRRIIVPGGGGPIITSLSGSTTHGQTIVINGQGFGTRPDHHTAAGTGLVRAWNPFSNDLEAGGWVQDGQDPENCNLSTSSPLGEACGQFYRKTHVSANQGSIEVVHGSNFTGRYYFCGYYRESANSPVIGSAACTKYFRRYLGPNQGGLNWLLGPNFENFTSFITPPAELNRWSAYPTAPFFPQDTWRLLEVVECVGSSGSGDGTALFGSPDFLAIRLGNVELIRRGTGLPSNPQPGQGTDANDNQQWTGVPPEGQEGGVTKLGSHLCETAAGYYMDFAEAYQDYGFSRVAVGPQSTYSANAALHFQIPTVWSAGQIEATVNRGQFASLSGLYLFVVTEDYEISPGFLIP
jgi:hypothetical protein